MTTDKARKRAIRTRMDKTGERYAAARRHVVTATSADDARPLPALPPRVTEPTMSEATIRKGTGRSWDEWFRLLDAWAATTHSHTEIARYVHEVHGVDGWWSQSVTVGYEWARGMRARHETPDGYQVSVSKTIAASAEDVWRDFVEPARRGQWLAPGTLRVRPGTGTVGKSARFDARGWAARPYLAGGQGGPVLRRGHLRAAGRAGRGGRPARHLARASRPPGGALDRPSRRTGAGPRVLTP